MKHATERGKQNKEGIFRGISRSSARYSKEGDEGSESGGMPKEGSR